jgi:hypothetical protein
MMKSLFGRLKNKYYDFPQTIKGRTPRVNPMFGNGFRLTRGKKRGFVCVQELHPPETAA